MAQFDVIALKSGEWVIDCQADLLSDISTRFVIPLHLPQNAPPVQPRLNPTFRIAGEPHVMVTQFAGAVPVSELGATIASLDEDQFTIKNAIDMLLTGI